MFDGEGADSSVSEVQLAGRSFLAMTITGVGMAWVLLRPARGVLRLMSAWMIRCVAVFLRLPLSLQLRNNVRDEICDLASIWNDVDSLVCSLQQR